MIKSHSLREENSFWMQQILADKRGVRLDERKETSVA